MRVINKIVSAVGRRVDESQPWVDARLADVSGYYFEDCNPVELKGPYATDAGLAARLWSESERLVAGYLA